MNSIAFEEACVFWRSPLCLNCTKTKKKKDVKQKEWNPNKKRHTRIRNWKKQPPPPTLILSNLGCLPGHLACHLSLLSHFCSYPSRMSKTECVLNPTKYNIRSSASKTKNMLFWQTKRNPWFQTAYVITVQANYAVINHIINYSNIANCSKINKC